MQCVSANGARSLQLVLLLISWLVGRAQPHACHLSVPLIMGACMLMSDGPEGPPLHVKGKPCQCYGQLRFSGYGLL